MSLVNSADGLGGLVGAVVWDLTVHSCRYFALDSLNSPVNDVALS